jgi:hypothetical protein
MIMAAAPKKQRRVNSTPLANELDLEAIVVSSNLMSVLLSLDSVYSLKRSKRIDLPYGYQRPA